MKGTKKQQHKDSKGSKASQGDGAEVGVNAFAGAKAGCHVGCEVSWLNPEQNNNWSEFASISAQGDAAAGIGGDAEFEVTYKYEKFVVKAKAGLVCGVGVSGSICTVVYARHIWNFVVFVYDQIRRYNFSFIGFIEKDAYTALSNLVTKYIVKGFKSLEATFEHEMKEIEDWWTFFVTDLLSTPNDVKLQKIETIAQNINNNPDALKFSLPEVKGRLLYLFTENGLRAEIKRQTEHWYNLETPNKSKIKRQVEQIQRAIIYVLSYIQSQNDFANVLQHMSSNGAKVGDAVKQQNEQTLYAAIGEYGRHFASGFPHSVGELINSLKNNTIYPVKPLQYQPVQKNQKVIQYA